MRTYTTNTCSYTFFVISYDPFNKERQTLQYSSHIVQKTDFLEFLHEYCKEKSETCTKL